MRAAFGGTSVFWKARPDFHFVGSKYDGVDSVHQVFEHVDFGAARSERADCHCQFHCYPLCLVELSSRTAKSDFARAHARRLSQLAPRPGNFSRRPGCTRGRNQSVSLARHFLSCLSPLLDGRDFPVIALVILLLLLPIPFRGWHQTLNDARDWQRGMLHYEQGGIAQRPERGYTWKNQSIFGLANRLLRRVSVDEAPSPPAYANVADLDFRTINIVIIASALLLGFSFVAAMPRQRAPEGDAREFAALLSLILIFTPLAFGYLFVWLMFPLALLIKRSLKAPASLIWLLIALALLTATGIAPRLAQIYGSLFFAASHALSRARDRSSARAKFNREIIFVQATVAPKSCLRLTAAQSLGARPGQSASPERLTSWISPVRDPETRSALRARAKLFVHAQLFRRRS